MPGISVQNGQLQAQGENIQQILVDGKPFFGNDVNAALQNLPAEVVANIQVFHKKSVKAEFTGFDDGERAKTINIVTKPDRRRGQLGKATGGYGFCSAKIKHRPQGHRFIRREQTTCRFTTLFYCFFHP